MSAPSSSSSSGKTFAELMSANGQGMADTGNKFANERAQRVAAQMAQQKQVHDRGQGDSSSPAAIAPVVLQYTPPADGSATPPRTFHID